MFQKEIGKVTDIIYIAIIYITNIDVKINTLSKFVNDLIVKSIFAK